MFTKINIQIPDENINLQCEQENCLTSTSASSSKIISTSTIKQCSEKDGLDYTADYIAKKFKVKYKELSNCSQDFEENVHNYGIPS